jgi:hypothetical protein
MEFGVLLSDLVRLQRNGAWSPEAVVKSAVAFVLDVPGTLTDQMISNVNFTYGTITN